MADIRRDGQSLRFNGQALNIRNFATSLIDPYNNIHRQQDVGEFLTHLLEQIE